MLTLIIHLLFLSGQPEVIYNTFDTEFECTAAAQTIQSVFASSKLLLVCQPET